MEDPNCSTKMEDDQEVFLFEIELSYKKCHYNFTIEELYQSVAVRLAKKQLCLAEKERKQIKVIYIQKND
jgi:hypothetical protein